MSEMRDKIQEVVKRGEAASNAQQLLLTLQKQLEGIQAQVDATVGIVALLVNRNVEETPSSEPEEGQVIQTLGGGEGRIEP